MAYSDTKWYGAIVRDINTCAFSDLTGRNALKQLLF